jgi:hypothetical protein
MKTFRVSCGDFVFGASVRKPEKVLPSDKQQYNIAFGGTNKCIDITLYKNQEKGWLSGLKHDVGCAFNKPLPRGDEGTVIMVKSAIAFIKKRYPFVTHFEFLDTSTISCKKKTRISLAYLQFAKYGKTWYSSKFGALPCDPDQQVRMATLNDFMESDQEKAKYSFDRFKQEHLDLEIEVAYKSFDNKEDLAARLLDVIKPVFEETKNFREFVFALDRKFPKNCLVFVGWLQPFLMKVGQVQFHQTHWSFSANMRLPPKISIRKSEESVFKPKRTEFDWMSTLPPSAHTGGKTKKLPF